jgi:predicted dehydrogenase
MVVRYGIVGCAGIGNNHARAVTDTEDGELVAVCDVDPDAATEFGAEYGVENHFTDVTTMVEAADVDAVSICTPSGTHGELSIGAAEAGADVLCEKPLEITVEDLNAMIESVEAAGARLGGVYQKRTYPSSRFAKAAIDDGRFGQFTLGDAAVRWFRSQPYYDSAEWRGTRALDGGVLMNQAPHYIDLLQWLGGGVESVRAHCETLARDMESEDTAVLLLQFENGAVGTIRATTTTPTGRSAVCLDGTTGSIGLREEDVTHYEVEVDDPDREHFTSETESPSPDLADYEFEYGTGHRGVVGDFVAAVRDDRPPMVPAREAREAIDINLAAYRSSETGREVALSELRP